MRKRLKYTQRVKLASGANLSALEFRNLAGDGHKTVRRKIAERTDVPPSVLHILSSDDDIGVRVAVAKNESTAPATLDLMTEDNKLQVLTPLLKHRNLLPTTLERLADYDGPANEALKAQRRSMQALVAKHPNTPFRTLEKLAEHPEDSVRYGVLRNLKTPKRILSQVVKCSFSSDQILRRVIRQNFFLDAEIVEKLTQSEISYVRREAYRALPKTPKVLERMSLHIDRSIRQLAAENPMTSETVLLRLCSDPDVFVRCSAAKNPNLTPAMVEKLSWDPHYNPAAILAEHDFVPENTLARLSTHENHFVRIAVSKNRNTPKYVLEQLCADTDRRVLGRLLENKGLTTLFLRAKLKHQDEHISDMLARRDAPRTDYQLARNDETPFDTLVALTNKHYRLEDEMAEMGPDYETYGWTVESLTERVKKKRLDLLAVIAGNRSATTALLDDLLQTVFDEGRSDLPLLARAVRDAARHPNMTADLIGKVFRQTEQVENEEQVAYSTRYARGYYLRRLDNIRQSIAACPVTSPDVLGHLASYDNARIRGRVATHPNTSARTLFLLANDRDFYVKFRVIRRDDLPDRIVDIFRQDPVLAEIYEACAAGEYAHLQKRSHQTGA